MLPRNEKITYWSGLHKYLPENLTSGKIYLETDTGEVYLDYINFKTEIINRIKLTDNTLMDISGGKFEGDVILSKDGTLPNNPVSKQQSDTIDNTLTSHIADKYLHIKDDDRLKWNDKVDKVPRKKLSENDFTDAYLEKLEGIYKSANNIQVSLVDNSNIDNLNELIYLGSITVTSTTNSETYYIYSPKPLNITQAEFINRFSDIHFIDGIEFNGLDNVSHFAISNEASTQPIKVIAIDNYVPSEGSKILLYMKNGNVVPNIRLKVNTEPETEIVLNDSKPAPLNLPEGAYTLIYHDNKYVIQNSVDTKLANEATTTTPGLISYEDQLKLNSAQLNANNYELPISSNTSLGGVIIGNHMDVSVLGAISLLGKDVIDILGYTPVRGTDISSGYLVEIFGSFIGASDASKGTDGLVPKPTIDDVDSYLCSDGTWKSIDVPVINDTFIYSLFALPEIFAVYSEDDNSLRFYNSSKPEVGSKFRNLTVTELYENFTDITNPEASTIPWYSKLNTLDTVKFEDRIKFNWAKNMFTACTASVMDITKLTIQNDVSDFNSMFNGCLNVEYLNLTGIENCAFENMSSMFSGCNSVDNLDISKFNTSNVTNMTSLFQNCSSITSFDFSNWNTSKVLNMGYIFNGCNAITHLDISTFSSQSFMAYSSTNNESFAYGLANMSNVVEIKLGEKFTLSECGILSGFLNDLPKLVDINLNYMKNWKMHDFTYSFCGLDSFKEIDLSHITYTCTSSPYAYFAHIFENCENLEILKLPSATQVNFRSILWIGYKSNNLKYIYCPWNNVYCMTQSTVSNTIYQVFRDLPALRKIFVPTSWQMDSSIQNKFGYSFSNDIMLSGRSEAYVSVKSEADNASTAYTYLSTTDEGLFTPGTINTPIFDVEFDLNINTIVEGNMHLKCSFDIMHNIYQSFEMSTTQGYKFLPKVGTICRIDISKFSTEKWNGGTDQVCNFVINNLDSCYLNGYQLEGHMFRLFKSYTDETNNEPFTYAELEEFKSKNYYVYVTCLPKDNDDSMFMPAVLTYV